MELILTEKWNQVAKWSLGLRHPVPDSKLHELWAARVQVSPTALAMVDANGESSSYAGINERAEMLKSKLVGTRGLFVATLLPQSSDYIASQIAVLGMEAVLVPMDPLHPQARILAILAEIGNPIVVTKQEIRDRLIPNYKRVIFLEPTNERANTIPNEIAQEQIITVFDKKAKLTESGTVREIANGITSVDEEYKHDSGNKPEAEGVAMCLFTSGTTGIPKGVYIKGSSIVNFVHWFIKEHAVTHCDTSIFYSTPSFDMAITQTWPFLISGGTVRVPPPEIRRNLPQLESWIDTNEITFLKLPSIVAFYFLKRINLKTIRFLAFGGELIPSLNGIKLPLDSPFRVGHSYGLTEGAMGQTNVIYGPGTTLNLSVGRPIANLEVWVLDPDMNILESGEVGDIYMGGAGICHNGYHNRPKENKRAYVGWKDGQILFKTGDVGMWDTLGGLHVTGRSDDQVKIAGNRVELGEIEILLSQHPLVSQAVVVYNKEPVHELKAFVTSLPSASSQLENLNIGGVTEFLRKKLPIHSIPSSIQVINALPLTANGKVDKRKLLELSTSFQSIRLPQTVDQIEMAALWGKALDFPVGSISLDHTFYQLGGNSLAAAQLLHNIKQSKWNRDVTFTQLFEHPTLHSFTELVVSQFENNVIERLQCDQLLEAVELELSTIDLSIASSGLQAEMNVGHGILLTGSTGYLGSFLLAELLRQTSSDVYCLVRAGTDSKALQRIFANMAANGINISVSESKRIVPVAADLTQANFGLSIVEYNVLSSAVHKIIHCAADVHHFRPYRNVEPVNVKGTTEIIKFSTKVHLKEIHYISTAAVNESYTSTWKETELGENGPICGSGYSQTKWVGEKVMIESCKRFKLTVCVYRIGDVGSDTCYKAYNHNDLFCNIIKSFLTTDSYIGGLEWPLYMKADLGSQALVKLFLTKPASGIPSVRHVGYRAKGAMDQELERIGLKRLSLLDWIQKIKSYGENNAIVQKHNFVSMEWFCNRLAEFGFNPEKFLTYLNFCWETKGTEELMADTTVQLLVIRNVDIRDYIQKIMSHDS